MTGLLIGLGVAAGVWLVAVAALAAAGKRSAARELAAFLPNLAILFKGLLRDRRVPRRSKAWLLVAVAWIASPVDLIPEFIPVAGPFDDAIVAALVLRHLLKTSGPDVVREYWRGDPAVLDRLLGGRGVRVGPEKVSDDPSDTIAWMATALADLVDPRRTALVTQECQNGVIGEHAVFPALAEAARREMIPNAARLVKAARAAGVPVVHCLALRRPDGLGSNTNARIFGAARKSPVTLAPGSDAARVIDEIGMEESDIVLTRLHGIGPMAGTDLDSVLRNLGAKTIVGIGVSVNVGMTNFAMDAVNLGYQFVLPRDAVAGVPEDYASAVIDNTLSLLATVVGTDELLAMWNR